MSRLPTIKAAELVKFLHAHGFVKDRQSGSHLVLWNPERKLSVTVPVHTGCDLGRGLTARILKDSGYTSEDFMQWR